MFSIVQQRYDVADMLGITEAQMAVLTRQAASDDVTRLTDFVAEQFVGGPLPHPRSALEAEVARTREQAIVWRLDDDASLRALLVLRFTFAADLAQIGWVRAVVDDPFGQKLERLVDEAGRRSP